MQIHVYGTYRTSLCMFFYLTMQYLKSTHIANNMIISKRTSFTMRYRLKQSSLPRASTPTIQTTNLYFLNSFRQWLIRLNQLLQSIKPPKTQIHKHLLWKEKKNKRKHYTLHAHEYNHIANLGMSSSEQITVIRTNPCSTHALVKHGWQYKWVQHCDCKASFGNTRSRQTGQKYCPGRDWILIIQSLSKPILKSCINLIK